MKKYFKKVKNLIGEGRIWGIALRDRTEKCLYEGNYSDFKFIKNSFRYWRADPFLFEYGGSTYVFAELFDRIKGKGIIGVAEIANGKCGRFQKCLEGPFHLSYPCVFYHDNDIYMVPECARSKKITVYKCIDFPCDWEKAYVVYDGAGVDTTPIISNNCASGFLSTIRTEQSANNDCLYYIDLEKKKHQLIKNDFTVRPAGHLLYLNDIVLRPSQDCTNSYGGALEFKKVNDINPNHYKEETFSCVHSSYITTNTKKYHFNGIHTYNQSQKYEIIDLSYDVGKSVQFILKKLIRHFKG